METLILTLDTIALMVVIYFSIRTEKSPGQVEQGPFRIKPYEPASAKAASKPGRNARSARAP